MLRRFIPIMISVMMIASMTPYTAAQSESNNDNGANDDLAAFEMLDEGEFAPGEVIAVFKEGAVRDRKISLSAAKDLDEIDSNFGDMMDAAGEADEAAAGARSEVNIIKESLGDDFIIKDSITYDEDLIMCLVYSDKYDTETMIKKLSGNDRIKSVEANAYLEPTSVDYSLDDLLNPYNYQANSPADNNTGGRNVLGRGTVPEQAVSLRAGAASDFASDHSSDDEVVVAVLDSGINSTHEDLKNMLWTNPGDIGLEGEHGFNFEDNSTELNDTIGHGTHCSGIIAAEANNAKGISGVASGVNVKIMMCALSGCRVDEDGNAINSDISTIFRHIGAMNYCCKAKQRGVNIVATSNSWGSPAVSNVYDEAINKMGEAGILTFVAASNDSLNIDKFRYSPPGGDSPYMVTVGSVDITGKPSGFTNYGKANVDLFAPGHSILSTSAWSIYSPSLYSAADRAENTEYYGAFNTSVEVGAEVDEELNTNRVVPSTAGEGVKPFGAARFFKQKNGNGGGEEPVDPEEPSSLEPADASEPSDTEVSENQTADETPEATCELSISEDKFFTDSSEPGSDTRPASLKVTIHNARFGEEYFVYFPFDKNHDTTGIDNTRYSLTAILQHQKEEYCANVAVGEIVKHENDGVVSITCNAAADAESTSQNDGDIENFTCGGKGNSNDALLSWEDSDPSTTDVTETGIGLCISPSAADEAPIEDDIISPDEIRDITIYIDSLGVSKPVTEEGKTPSDIFTKDSSYELMSGTSMATPAAAGAYAVLASLYHQKEGQTGSEYALENRARLFSIVRKTDSLRDLCSTGGYIDLSLIDSIADLPAITDAVCDVKSGTLTLHGIGLTSDMKLFCRHLDKSDAEETALPSGSMKISYGKDGKTITLSNAKDLFGRYLEFILKNGEEVMARGSFYTVKGQNEPEKILTEEHKETFGKETYGLPPRQIFTDTSGKELYAYQLNSYSLYEESAGVLYKFDGTKFTEYQGTKLKDALFDYYEKELGYNRHQITRGLEVKPLVVRQLISEDNVIYDFVTASYTPYLDAEEEKIERVNYLAALNYTAKDPKWTFTKVPFISEVVENPENLTERELSYCAMNGKIYCFGSTVDNQGKITEDNNFTFAYALDIKKGTWERKADLKGIPLRNTDAYYNNGKIWLMFGAVGKSFSNAVYSFDGASWEKAAEIPFVGRSDNYDHPADGCAAPVKDGFILFDYSVDGAGNVSLLNTSTGKCEPLYYTIGTGLSDPAYTDGSSSAVETVNGIYYCMLTVDSGQVGRIDMYRIPKTSYGYTPRYKSVNPAKITKKNVTAKAKGLKKKSFKKSALTVKGAKGTVTYKLAKIKCSKKLLKDAKKKIKINSKTGKISIRKGLKKGKYNVTVTVRAKGDLIYLPLTKKVTFRITVR